MNRCNNLLFSPRVDYIPVLSTVKSLYELFEKVVVIPNQINQNGSLNDRQISVQKKFYTRLIVLLFPVVGNLVVGLYDFLKPKASLPICPESPQGQGSPAASPQPLGGEGAPAGSAQVPGTEEQREDDGATNETNHSSGKKTRKPINLNDPNAVGRKMTNGSPFNFKNVVPLEKRQDPKFMLVLVRDYEFPFENLEQNLKDNEELALLALEKYGHRIFLHFSERLKNNSEFIQKAREVALEYLRKQQRDFKTVLTLANTEGVDLCHIENELKLFGPNIFSCLPEDYKQNSKIIESCFKQGVKDDWFKESGKLQNELFHAVKTYCPEILRDSSKMLQLIEQDFSKIQDIDALLKRNPNFMLQAMESNPEAFLHVDPSLFTNPDFMLNAIRLRAMEVNSVVFDSLDPSLRRNQNFMLDVIKIDKKFKTQVDQSLLDQSNFKKALCFINPDEVLDMVTIGDLKIEEIARMVVPRNLKLFSALPEDLKNNRALLVLIAIKWVKETNLIQIPPSWKTGEQFFLNIQDYISKGTADPILESIIQHKIYEDESFLLALVERNPSCVRYVIPLTVYHLNTQIDQVTLDAIINQDRDKEHIREDLQGVNGWIEPMFKKSPLIVNHFPPEMVTIWDYIQNNPDSISVTQDQYSIN